eukprot:NODE_213_length_12556_cov_0.937063.p9 type:complete len:236 gc:universal NODE_213_length_12556_cov_0.937063:1386-679(-)
MTATGFSTSSSELSEDELEVPFLISDLILVALRCSVSLSSLLLLESVSELEEIVARTATAGTFSNSLSLLDEELSDDEETIFDLETIFLGEGFLVISSSLLSEDDEDDDEDAEICFPSLSCKFLTGEAELDSLLESELVSSMDFNGWTTVVLGVVSASESDEHELEDDDDLSSTLLSVLVLISASSISESLSLVLDSDDEDNAFGTVFNFIGDSELLLSELSELLSVAAVVLTCI